MIQVGPVAIVLDWATVLTGLVSAAASVFLLTVVIGTLSLGVAPGFTYRTMGTVSDDTAASCVYGLAVLLGLVALALTLGTTVIEFLLAVPLLLFAVALWAVGAAIAGTAIGVRLVGYEDGLLRPLLVGAGINAALTLTGVGLVAAVAIGATGFGAIIRSGPT